MDWSSLGAGLGAGLQTGGANLMAYLQYKKQLEDDELKRGIVHDRQFETSGYGAPQFKDYSQPDSLAGAATMAPQEAPAAAGAPRTGMVSSMPAKNLARMVVEPGKATRTPLKGEISLSGGRYLYPQLSEAGRVATYEHGLRGQENVQTAGLNLQNQLAANADANKTANARTDADTMRQGLAGYHAMRRAGILPPGTLPPTSPTEAMQYLAAGDEMAFKTGALNRTSNENVARINNQAEVDKLNPRWDTFSQERIAKLTQGHYDPNSSAYVPPMSEKDATVRAISEWRISGGAEEAIPPSARAHAGLDRFGPTREKAAEVAAKQVVGGHNWGGSLAGDVGEVVSQTGGAVFGAAVPIGKYLLPPEDWSSREMNPFAEAKYGNPNRTGRGAPAAPRPSSPAGPSGSPGAPSATAANDYIPPPVPGGQTLPPPYQRVIDAVVAANASAAAKNERIHNYYRQWGLEK